MIAPTALTRNPVPLSSSMLFTEMRDSEEPAPSGFWNGMRVIGGFLYESVTKVGLFVLIGIAALFVIPSAAYPLFMYSGVTVLTKLVVKVLDRYDLRCINKLKEKVFDFSERFPVQIISLIASVALSLIFQIGGCIIAGAGGIINGIRVGTDTNLQTQDFNREENKQPPPVRGQVNLV